MHPEEYAKLYIVSINFLNPATSLRVLVFNCRPVSWLLKTRTDLARIQAIFGTIDNPDKSIPWKFFMIPLMILEIKLVKAQYFTYLGFSVKWNIDWGEGKFIRGNVNSLFWLYGYNRYMLVLWLCDNVNISNLWNEMASGIYKLSKSPYLCSSCSDIECFGCVLWDIKLLCRISKMKNEK